MDRLAGVGNGLRLTVISLPLLLLHSTGSLTHIGAVAVTETGRADVIHIAVALVALVTQTNVLRYFKALCQQVHDVEPGPLRVPLVVPDAG